MKNFILTLFAVMAFTLGVNTAQAQVVVRVKPNRPAVVVAKPAKKKARHVWIAGHWRYNKKAQKYVWIKGHWAKAPKGQGCWVPGHWKTVEGGHQWVPGHWKRC